MRTKKITEVEEFQFEDPIEKEIPKEEVEKEFVLDEKKETIFPNEPFEVIRTYHNPQYGWMRGRRLECVVCGKKEYPAYELVGIRYLNGERTRHRMSLVCYDCLAKNSYEKRFIRGEWEWKKKLNKRQEEKNESV